LRSRGGKGFNGTEKRRAGIHDKGNGWRASKKFVTQRGQRAENAFKKAQVPLTIPSIKKEGKTEVREKKVFGKVKGWNQDAREMKRGYKPDSPAESYNSWE